MVHVAVASEIATPTHGTGPEGGDQTRGTQDGRPGWWTRWPTTLIRTATADTYQNGYRS